MGSLSPGLVAKHSYSPFSGWSMTLMTISWPKLLCSTLEGIGELSLRYFTVRVGLHKEHRINRVRLYTDFTHDIGLIGLGLHKWLVLPYLNNI